MIFPWSWRALTPAPACLLIWQCRCHCMCAALAQQISLSKKKKSSRAKQSFAESAHQSGIILIFCSEPTLSASIYTRCSNHKKNNKKSLHLYILQLILFDRTSCWKSMTSLVMKGGKGEKKWRNIFFLILITAKIFGKNHIYTSFSLCSEFPSHHQWLRQPQIFIHSGAPASGPTTAHSPEQWTPKTQQRPQLRVWEWNRNRTLSVQQPSRTLCSQWQ